jgi:hypothetical protein
MCLRERNAMERALGALVSFEILMWARKASTYKEKERLIETHANCGIKIERK